MVATYASMATILVGVITAIIPAMMIINVIWWTRELHTQYFFFLAHLLATNITSAIAGSILGYLVMILYLLDLNSDSAVIIVKWVSIAPFLLLRLMTVFAPMTLAIERMITIAFPFRHRSIITTKTASGMLAAMWGTSVVLTIIVITIVPFNIVWPLALVYWDQIIYPFIVMPRLISIISIVAANIFLQYKITISNRKAKENQRLGNEEEVKRFKNLLQEVRAQVNTTITLFIVGGIGVIGNILLPVIYVIIDTSVEPSKKVYVLRFSLQFIEACVFLSQILVYGYCTKKIRKRLPNCTIFHRQWFTRHNRVGIMHQRPEPAVNNATT